MAEKSLFFNALEDSTSPTGYDRNYNADDISDWLSVVWENGIVKSNTGLKVVATTGMILNVESGRGAIKGKAYINRSLKSFTVPSAPISATRYDYIVLRYNNEVSTRAITCEYKVGTTTRPTVSDLVRTENIYELLLGIIEVGVSVTTITQAKITDTRGDEELCPYFTAVKGYDGYYDALIQRYESRVTVPSLTLNVESNLSVSLFNDQYSLLTVYTNGIKEDEDAYTVNLSGSHIEVEFTTNKVAGSKVTFVLENFIDGEGLSTAINDYNNWTNAVEVLEQKNEYNYVCNGVNDNIVIGNLVRAYLSNGGNGSAKFNIIGNIGFTASAGGSGTTSNPYTWFNFNVTSTAKAIVDFTRCSTIQPTIANGTYNVIFHVNNDIDIVGANVVANNSNVGTTIRIVNSINGVIYFEKCRFWINGYQDSLIGLRGTFTNCRGSIANTINNSYCFLPNTQSVVKVVGGEYYAYTGDSARQSAIVGQSGGDAVSILYGVNAPQVARSGLYQTHSIYQISGGGIVNCTDLISPLPLQVIAGASNIRGTIAKNKVSVG